MNNILKAILEIARANTGFQQVGLFSTPFLGGGKEGVEQFLVHINLMGVRPWEIIIISIIIAP